MTVPIDIAARLRAANPLPGVPIADPPAGLLERISSTPRASAERRRRRSARRPLLVAGIALLLAGGIAIAATISVRYFDESGSKPLPARVSKAIVFGAAHFGPVGTLDLDHTITAYAFTSSSADGRVYMTPYVKQPGFCAALAVVGKPVSVACSTGFASKPATLAGEQPWSLTLTPDMHAMLGRLSAAATGETVRLVFEDGTSTALPMQGRWFAYAVAGIHTQPGRRPTELRFLRDGKLVRRSTLSPVSFNTLAEARALVPRSDGSAAQNAIRGQLLDEIESRMGDGGLFASHTKLSDTRFVTSLSVGSHLKVSVYAVPVTPIPSYGSAGGALVAAVGGQARRPLFMATSAFGFPGAEGGAALPGHPQAQLTIMTGATPARVRRVSVRTTDGRETPAVLFDNGRGWVWLARSAPGLRPVEVIGRDASGAIVLRRRALGARGRP
jgi:hypothetical protein